MSRETDIALTELWLNKKQCTLWQEFDISDPVRRRKAAEWFVDQQAMRDKFVSDYVMNKVVDL